ncbi:MAG: nucleotidyltransferase substrate binding protein [Verrucomicrobia bacterium]|nr:nucleotidyltransferase substrate binding protein [Verrucomicrobiota bacterium]
MHSDFRWKQRFQNFQKSLVDFRSALDKTEYTILEQAGLIQLFEVSFELAWKTLKDLLFYEGFEVNSPRETIKQAFASDILSNPEIWLEALEGRNRFSHTYDKKLAEDSIRSIRIRYAPLLFELENTLKKRLNG